MAYKVIITGTTGMVGEGVLIECLAHPQISAILSVSRKPCGIKHDKLQEYLMSDFSNLADNDENLKGYDACFFCAGVSSIGMSEVDYTRTTFGVTVHFTKVLLHENPNMTLKLTAGQKNAVPLYKYFAWMYPLLKLISPNSVSTLQQVGRAMINTLTVGSDKQIMEVTDINALGDR